MIGVVYLAWAPAGLEPVRRFLRSYTTHEAGAEHELIVVLKEFADDDSAEEHRLLFAAVAHKELRWPRRTPDIPAYLGAAQGFDHELICGLNTQSQVLADNWLGALADHATRPGVGLAGATGSWESHLTGARELRRGSAPVRAVTGSVAALVKRRHFPPFPNPHVRTSGFVLRRELLLELAPPSMADKHAVHCFESGHRSLTREVLRSGLRAIVVGLDGRPYPPEEWPDSATFRAGGQRNLLVADNRTRQYADADPQQQALLRRLAWGAAAAGVAP